MSAVRSHKGNMHGLILRPASTISSLREALRIQDYNPRRILFNDFPLKDDSQTISASGIFPGAILWGNNKKHTSKKNQVNKKPHHAQISRPEAAEEVEICADLDIGAAEGIDKSGDLDMGAAEAMDNSGDLDMGAAEVMDNSGEAVAQEGDFSIGG